LRAGREGWLESSGGAGAPKIVPGYPRDPPRCHNTIGYDWCESPADIFLQLVGVNLTLNPPDDLNTEKKFPDRILLHDHNNYLSSGRCPDRNFRVDERISSGCTLSDV